VFRKDGYKDFPVVADLGADRTLHVSLNKLPPPERPAPGPQAASDSSRRRPAAASSGSHRGGHRPRGPAPDEDGLATPSF
jgi:hypothetical protein